MKIFPTLKISLHLPLCPEGVRTERSMAAGARSRDPGSSVFSRLGSAASAEGLWHCHAAEKRWKEELYQAWKVEFQNENAQGLNSASLTF